MESTEELFLSRACRKAWEDYLRALRREDVPCWDYIILTASNERQAEGFRMQLEERRAAGLLPLHIRFAVLPDPEGRRVGSGGATLHVLRRIAQREGGFAGRRVLVIHSGGDSKRVPQYSALGKLFSPVPRLLPDGRASTLFDELLIGLSGVPARFDEGMLLLSGDVLLLFDAGQIALPAEGAAALSFKEDAQTGKDHGVFLMGESGNVAEFLHKQTTGTLAARGAIDERGCVDIDTGAVFFSGAMMNALYGLLCEGNTYSQERFDAFVNEEVRLSLYGDFLYPLAEGSTLEGFYREKPEGCFCGALTEARTAVWNALRPFRMRLMRLSPAKFIHFGTTREIMRLMNREISGYAHLGWQRCVNSCIAAPGPAAYNSILSENARCGENVYLEASRVHGAGRVGSNVLLSCVEIEDETIPDNVVLHGVRQKDGGVVVRIYGIEDDPKAEGDAPFLGATLGRFMQNNNISEEELWDEKPHSLWNAKLYPECGDEREAVAAALNVYAMAHGRGDAEAWRSSRRKSLCEGFREAFSTALIAWERRMRELVQMERVAESIRAGEAAEEAARHIRIESLTHAQKSWLAERLARADFGESIRLCYYLGKVIGGGEGEEYIDMCFSRIRGEILKSAPAEPGARARLRIRMDEHTVRLPLRVNWGGGWSDTPPYCNEQGGAVLNAAITLNGEYPVRVTLRRLDEKKIALASTDMGVRAVFGDIEPLQSSGDPCDPFALHKAALQACGIIPARGGALEDVLEQLGGGISMQTEVVGVPQGSGLGTSSILAGACVQVLSAFTGVECGEDELYSRVLCIEQLMSTGGGWQDQVGGLCEGVKYITSRPGLRQRLTVEQVSIDQAALDELNGRFALIYTGQRRLARNLLRDVMGRYLGSAPQALAALERIRRMAGRMRLALEQGDVDAFAALLNEHWELSKQLDEDSANACIERIFRAVEDLIDGRMICGAGGGGFLQVVLKKGVAKEELERRLRKVFPDGEVCVWRSVQIRGRRS
ncbi:MAG: L-fucokinase [Eubacteriales bacterium]|nr:L-fucokinase [Eubacteriales bacterium]